MARPTIATLHVAPGPGLLVRRPAALLFTAAPDHGLVDAFGAAPLGGELQALASATVAAGFAVAPFVALTWDGVGRVMAFGDVAVETDQPSLPMLSGAGSRTWVEHSLPIVDGAVVEVAGADADAATDLMAGTVLAGGFRLEVRAAAEPAPALEVSAEPAAAREETTAVPRARPGRPEAPAAGDDPNDPVAALAAIQAGALGAGRPPLDEIDPHDPDVTLPPPASGTLLADVRADAASGRGPLVDAKLCAHGHANPPTAAACGVCAEFLAPGTTAVVHVTRPSLGRLQLDDGELIELDQELLVGRNPDRDDDPSRASLRRVKTVGEKVSRSHLEVRFQGWDVLVADCGSTNGTFVVAHPGGQVTALEPGRPQLVDPGAVVYFGSRSFTVLGRDDAR